MTAPTSAQIIRLASRLAGVPEVVLLGPRRTRNLAWARQRVMFVTRKLRPDLSLPQIGRALRRDHTTVIHAIRAVAKRIAESPRKPRRSPPSKPRSTPPSPTTPPERSVMITTDELATIISDANAKWEREHPDGRPWGEEHCAALAEAVARAGDGPMREADTPHTRRTA